MSLGNIGEWDEWGRFRVQVKAIPTGTADRGIFSDTIVHDDEITHKKRVQGDVMNPLTMPTNQRTNDAQSQTNLISNVQVFGLSGEDQRNFVRQLIQNNIIIYIRLKSI